MKRKKGQKSFYRLVVSLMVLIIGVTFVLTTVVSNHYVRQNMVENALLNGMRSTKADASSLSIYLSSIRRISRELYYNGAIYAMLYQEELDYEDDTMLFAFLQSLMNQSDNGEITQIFLQSHASGRSYLVGANGRIAGDTLYDLELPNQLEKYQAYCEAPHSSHSYGMDLTMSSVGAEVCSFHWNIYNAMGNKIIGTLSIDVDVEQMAGYLTAVKMNTPAYILDGEGTIIYANVQLLDEEQREELRNPSGSTSWSQLDENGFQGIAFCQTVDDSMVNWTIIELVSNQELYQASNNILRWEILFMAAAGCACVVVVALVLYRMIRPLMDLRGYVQAVESGDLNADIRNYTSYDRRDEIGILIEHMKSMISTIQEMFVRQQKLSQAHRSVEMKMLLAQINPHFIYNALQSISTLALVHNDKEVYSLLTKLGAEMQYSMDLEAESAPLSQEIRYTANYFELQKQRFDNRFSYDIQLEDGVELIPVPRMMLQPLAENAIKHGLIHRMTGGFVHIRIFWEKEWLVVEIEDNGKGCSPERQEELNSAFQIMSERELYRSEHIGMHNVNYRLKLMYGENVFMKIGTSRWSGTMITVRIPVGQYGGGIEHESPDC